MLVAGRTVTTITRSSFGTRQILRCGSTSTSVPATGGSSSQEPKLPPEIANYEPTPADWEADPQLAGLKYPQLNLKNRQYRNPKGWWFQQQRTNFNEPRDINDDILSLWAPAEPKIPPFEAAKKLAVALTILGGLFYTIYAVQPAPKWAPQSFPRDGLASEFGGQHNKALTPEDIKRMYEGGAEEEEE